MKRRRVLVVDDNRDPDTSKLATQKEVLRFQGPTSSECKCTQKEQVG
jgi:hypothetical protein